uniref:CMP-sialic acid transporter isoform X2 n=1 Tax=Myxine glutinosa TaxID=7769 RepID=UPI00358E65EA
MTAPEKVSMLFKLYCLVVMTVVAATYIVVLRYTRTVSTDKYFSTTAVFLTEVVKLIISLGMLSWEVGGLRCMASTVLEEVIYKRKETLKLCVPSLVYALQNNMAFVALSNLDAAVYQVTYQLKIPCTAMCSVLMLGRSLSYMQWFSIFLLCGGVSFVQWKPLESTAVHIVQNPLIGMVATAVAVLCSGFAGVYFEKVLKSSSTSLWIRNIQMYLWGILMTFGGVVVNDGFAILQEGFLFGYTPLVCLVILLASMGGLYTSVVVKYTDNIMKSFSAASAIVLSTLASMYLFELHLSYIFVAGTTMVCISIYLYGLPKLENKNDSSKQEPKKMPVSV